MKISVYIATTLDGFIARKNDALDWLPGSDGSAVDGTEGDCGYSDFMATVDVLVMGRRTFEQVLSFGAWPYSDKRVIVLSKRRDILPQHPPASIELSALAPEELCQQLRKQGVQHVYLDGGKTIQGFLIEKLVDELILTTVPVLIGEGLPLFGLLDSDQQWHLKQSRSYANGFVQSHYVRVDRANDPL